MTNGQPVIPLLLKAAMTTTLEVRTPMSSQGLNLPHLVLVLSMMLPMIGSLSASKTLAATMIPVMAVSWAAVRLFVIITNVSR